MFSIVKKLIIIKQDIKKNNKTNKFEILKFDFIDDHLLQFKLLLEKISISLIISL